MLGKPNVMLSKLDLMMRMLYIVAMTKSAEHTLPLDDAPMPMTLGERVTWIYGVLVPLAAIGYFAVVLPPIADTPLSQIAWQIPMIVAIAAVIVGTIAATIVSAIVAAIVTRDVEQSSDIRDTEISQRGERATLAVTGVGIALVLVLAMIDADQFVIGSALFAVGAVSAVWASIVKIRSYRSRFDG